MSEKPIDTGPAEPTSLDQQRIVWTLLGQIADRYPGLPPASITVYAQSVGCNVALVTADAFEQWRMALGIPAPLVDLHLYANVAWISATATIRSVRFGLTADVPVAPHLAAVSPVADAERRGRVQQLAAQYQQQPAAVQAPNIAPPVAVPVTPVPLAERPGGGL